MPKRLIVTLEDRTTHGGTVVSASQFTDTSGKPWARVGDQVVCKRCKKVTTIVTGDATMVVDGAPVARHGDLTSCGARLMAGSQGVSSVSDDASTSAGTPPMSPLASTSPQGAARTPEYDQGFQLVDELSGQPLTRRRYRIVWSGGAAEGLTDDDGMTRRIETPAPEELQIEVFPEGDPA
jgi:uncharacterized Zn-binding protein involved in type VI secretion